MRNGAEQALREEIARIVLEAKASGEVIRAGYHAGMLVASHPASFSLGRIIDELVMEATRHGVPIEITRYAGDM